MAQLQSIDIPAPHGQLEGLLRLPDGDSEPPLAALVCHPHPIGGGTMHNKVVFRIAQALGDLGFPVLRFNFRGVGKSSGHFDEGRGEADDVRTALDELARRFPNRPLALAGFSFGSWVGLPAGCADERVRQLIGVGVPVASLMVDGLSECQKHKLIVQGDHDQYGPAAQLTSWFAKLPEPKSLAIIPGAEHFFLDYQPQLYAAIHDYFATGHSVLGTLAR